MAKIRLKTVSYRRAVWLDPERADSDLEKCLVKAHAKLKKVSERKFKRGDGQFVKGYKWEKARGGGHFFHIVAETPGDHASTLAHKFDEQEQGNVATAPPPRGTEFMDGDIFLYVNGNDVCVCSSVLRDGSVKVFCDEIFRKAKLGDNATKFDLRKVSNVDKAKMIATQGVKEIDIRATLYDATTKYINRKGPLDGFVGAAGRHFQAIFGKESQPSSGNLSVGISISADGRSTGKKLGAQQLSELASDAIDSDDDYIIITKTGQRITPTEIYVRTKVPIERVGKSTHCESTWAALKSFYQTLSNSGVTAQ